MLKEVQGYQPGAKHIGLDGQSFPANENQQKLYDMFKVDPSKIYYTLPGTQCRYWCTKHGPGAIVATENFIMINGIRHYKPNDFNEKPSFVLAANIDDAKESVAYYNHGHDRLFS